MTASDVLSISTSEPLSVARMLPASEFFQILISCFDTLIAGFDLIEFLSVMGQNPLFQDA